MRLISDGLPPMRISGTEPRSTLPLVPQREIGDAVECRPVGGMNRTQIESYRCGRLSLAIEEE